jgi:hypothetical protein
VSRYSGCSCSFYFALTYVLGFFFSDGLKKGLKDIPDKVLWKIFKSERCKNKGNDEGFIK